MLPERAARKADISFICSGMNGGVGTYILNMYEYMRTKGYRVHLVCLEEERTLLPDTVPDADIFTLSSLKYKNGTSVFARYLEFTRPAVIITSKFRQTIIALRAKASIKAKTRIYPVIHNTCSAEFIQLPLSKRLLRILRLRHYYPKCDGIICVSAGVASDLTSLTRIPDSAVSVLYNPVHSSDIMSRAAQPLDHSWFGQDQPPVVLGIGRLAAQKNFQLLIEAFEIIRARVSTRLLILGEGPQRTELERRIQASPYSGDISMPGHVSNPFAYLKRSALLTLSSIYEGLPTVLIEALSTGTPVVSTDCPSGPREILKDGEYGKIVPMNDPLKLAEAMFETLASPPPPEILQKRASEFGIQTSCENYLRFLGFTRGDHSA